VTLRLDDNGITDAGALAVAASPHLANIRELHLYVDEEEDGIAAEEG
jgi:hypothetical protein